MWAAALLSMAYRLGESDFRGPGKTACHQSPALQYWLPRRSWCRKTALHLTVRKNSKSQVPPRADSRCQTLLADPFLGGEFYFTFWGNLYTSNRSVVESTPRCLCAAQETNSAISAFSPIPLPAHWNALKGTGAGFIRKGEEQDVPPPHNPGRGRLQKCQRGKPTRRPSWAGSTPDGP